MTHPSSTTRRMGYAHHTILKALKYTALKHRGNFAKGNKDL